MHIDTCVNESINKIQCDSRQKIWFSRNFFQGQFGEKKFVPVFFVLSC